MMRKIRFKRSEPGMKRLVPSDAGTAPGPGVRGLQWGLAMHRFQDKGQPLTRR